MDFNNRDRSASQPTMTNRVAGSPTPASSGKRSNGWKEKPMWLRAVWVVLFCSAIVLAVAMLVLLYFGGPSESKYIDKDRQQAVFLTNGQVYFGKVKTVNSQYLELRGIYYLNVDQQVQPNQENSNQQSSVRLVKLGCELHGPVDRMVINREQVSFWENLKENSQVSVKIAEWVKANPNGQKCETTAAQPATDAAKP